VRADRPGGRLTISEGKVVHIDMLAAADSLDDLDLTILGD
jgi:hypothetical protein